MENYPIPFEERRWNIENPPPEIEELLEKQKELNRNYSSNSK